MYKSFKFVLFNKSFPNPEKFQIWPNLGRSQTSAGFWPEPELKPNSSTVLKFITLKPYQRLTPTKDIFQ